MASRRLKVATTFSLKCMSGFVVLTLTSGFAAKWKTASTPRTAFWASWGFLRSPIITSTSRRWARFSSLPLLRLSITLT